MAATARPGAAQATDARVTAPGLLGRLRPGPGAALEPMGPGPRPRVAPGALLSRGTAIGPRWAHQLAVQAGGKPTPPPPYTEADARAVSAVRKAAVGRSAPMTYRRTYVAPFRSSSAPTDAPAPAGGDNGSTGARSCADCG